MSKKIKTAIMKRSKTFKREIKALYLAYKRPDVPLYAKLCAIIVVGYALSPIDLIPDFIPILGYLDDLILIPVGIFIAVRLIPKDIINECRKQAESMMNQNKRKNWFSAVIIISIWIAIVVIIIKKLY